jgi:hypothetical protein
MAIRSDPGAGVFQDILSLVTARKVDAGQENCA